MYDTDMIEVKVNDDNFSAYLRDQGADAWAWSNDGSTCTFFAQGRIVARVRDGNDVDARRVLVPLSFFDAVPHGSLVDVAA